MTHALVTQMLNALEYHQLQTRPIHNTELAIEAAREYLATEPAQTLTEALAQQGIKLRTEFEPKQRDSELATEPSGERAELIAKLRTGWTVMEESEFERLDGLCRKAADMLEADAQQAKRVPMTDREISEIVNRYYRLMGPAEFARAIEAHHGITEPAEKPTVDEPEEEDLYALALKADNWGQP